MSPVLWFCVVLRHRSLHIIHSALILGLAHSVENWCNMDQVLSSLILNMDMFHVSSCFYPLTGLTPTILTK